jgi:hypothetical protein
MEMKARMRAVLKTFDWALLNFIVFVFAGNTVFLLVGPEVCSASHLVTDYITLF